MSTSPKATTSRTFRPENFQFRLQATRVLARFYSPATQYSRIKGELERLHSTVISDAVQNDQASHFAEVTAWEIPLPPSDPTSISIPG